MDGKILLILLHIVKVFSIELEGKERVACDGLIFHDVYLDKELLFHNLGRPYNLVIHKFSGTLFFSHTTQNDTHADFVITSCIIKSKKCRNIPGIQGGYAIAYDSGNDDIYFGGHDGIFKYNFLSKSAEYFAEEGKSIWGLFIKKHFYFIEYPSQKLYVYQDEGFTEVAEARNIEIDNFFISKFNNIYFSNKTALYKVERPYPDVVMLDDDISVRQMVEDAYGDAYFVASDGIYIEDRPFNRVKKVADINQAFGLAFDESDNAIYSDKDAIYKLTPSKHSVQCFHALKAVKEIEIEEKAGKIRPEKDYRI